MIKKSQLFLHNSLSRKKELFSPLRGKNVRIYTCGPTVYDYPTIGNWRTYITSDILTRTLSHLGYSPTHVMNITDVGHLTGDNEGDASVGEDRLEQKAEKTKKTAKEVVDFFEKDFADTLPKLNIQKPYALPKATEYIKEQIELVKKIEKKGFTYTISDGVYFDVQAFEKRGNTYGALSDLAERHEGARVPKNPERKDPRDFALWKKSETDSRRQMEWDSPWGRGFPGWHIECSAMSMKFFGDTFDIHTGGADLKSTHHPNEIAQSEAVTNKKPFVRYWLHTTFLQIDGKRMGKSEGNAYTIHDVEKKYSPLSFRYLVLNTHYRSVLNFTWDALEQADSALSKLRMHTKRLQEENGNKNIFSYFKERSVKKEMGGKFNTALSDDLNTPAALAVLWETIRSTDISPNAKYELAVLFQKTLGIFKEEHFTPPEHIKKLAERRLQLRNEKKWTEADAVRKEIDTAGYTIEDRENGFYLFKK